MMQKTTSVFIKTGAIVFVLLFLAQQQLFGWSAAIKIAEQEGSELKKPVACFSPQGKLFIVYDAGAQIHLSSYDGTKVAFEKRVSESTLLAYEPCMFINKRGVIHIVWIECSSFGSNTQYIKYRSYNGSSWSPVTVLQTLDIPGTLPGGFVTRKVEDLRMAVDENNNVFLVYMVWPAGRCQFISKYDNLVQLETWPMAGRSKHPDVAVDSNFVHITWQQLWSSDYTIAYCKRSNSSGGRFQTVVDVRDGAHRPRIAVDPSRVPHIFQMDDYQTSRITLYKYWTGNGFSQKYVVSDDGPRLYNNIGICVFDNSNIFTMALTTTEIYYNWKQKGVWSGHRLVEKVRSRPDGTWAALSPDGKTAVIAYTDRGNSVYINLSSDEITPPTPPTPPVINNPPIALFTFAPFSGLYPLRVTFNAQNSSDSDGQIVSYSWDFGDGAKGSGALLEHIFQSKGLFRVILTVTDDDGASATASGELVVFGVAPPLNVQFQRYVNRNLFSVEYLYRLVWNPNPRNDEIGSKIVAYKIYRREIGKGGFVHFYTLQTGNQPSYEYLDRSLGSAARDYEYAVSSLDSNGRESDWN
jgi:PKD repeat protein